MTRARFAKLIKTIIKEALDSASNYTFDDFDYLAKPNGFGVPTDVKYKSTYIGTIESMPEGYQIVLIDTPKSGKQVIRPNKKQNVFKSKDLAATQLHKVWKLIRSKGMF